MSTQMHLAWIDLRRAADPAAVAEEALHAGAQGIAADDPKLLATLPPTVKRIGVVTAGTERSTAEELADGADVLLVDHTELESYQGLAETAGVELGAWIVVSDHATLEIANFLPYRAAWTVIDFVDTTKIPLEIVLAAADRAQGKVVTLAHDVEEAGIIFDVLERGSDGVFIAPEAVGEAGEVARIAQTERSAVAMDDLEVLGIRHLGLGDRLCIDTCSKLGEDEGILVGSFASGMVLVSSETHPLPYMPLRPFRVNAGALHSYTLGPNNRTRYLSELEAGSEILAVRTNGETRRVVVGRAKLESRPLLEIRARSAEGTVVNLILQDDWHVRVLGPQAEVCNVTELKPGDRLAGHTLAEPRHVGYAVREFLQEK